MAIEPYEVPRGSVIHGGRHVPCMSPVIHWDKSGLVFRVGRGGRKRTEKIDLVVWHHTGGEGAANSVYRTLNERSLGIEFIIDRDGMIWQCCDAAQVDTFDAGAVNARSIGVEIVSAGMPGERKSDRGEYETTVHGKKATYLNLYPKQLRAACDLAETLSAATGIPRQFPQQMREIDLSGFAGHIGHFHVTGRKPDPGTQLFDELERKGFKRV